MSSLKSLVDVLQRQNNSLWAYHQHDSANPSDQRAGYAAPCAPDRRAFESGGKADKRTRYRNEK